jgi:hypothetical protein
MARAVLLLVRVLAEGAAEGGRMRARENRERNDPLGIAMRGGPAHVPAPIVADEVQGLCAVPLLRGEIQHVADQAVHRVRVEIGGIGPHARRVAALIGRDGAIASGTERGDLLAPRVPRLWEAMEQEYQGGARGAGDVRREAALRRGDQG